MAKLQDQYKAFAGWKNFGVDSMAATFEPVAFGKEDMVISLEDLTSILENAKADKAQISQGDQALYRQALASKPPGA